MFRKLIRSFSIWEDIGEIHTGFKVRPLLWCRHDEENRDPGTPEYPLFQVSGELDLRTGLGHLQKPETEQQKEY
jgi:hypothetical protein